MPELTLLPAKTNDIEKLNKLMLASKAHWGYDQAFLDKFMDLFALDEESLAESVTKLAYSGDKFIGFLGFIKHEKDLELDTLFVHPRYIGHGYGKALWQHCLTTMRELGYSSFFILADPNANNFYLKMGCVEIAKKPSVMAAGRFNSIFRYTETA